MPGGSSRTPSMCSKAPTTGPRLSETSTPSATPVKVPSRPTIEPCTMKMDRMERDEAPSVRRMAMSARLSVTVITSMDTRLNAATAMISARMMNIMRFSTCTAANHTRFSSDQSRT